MDPRIRICTRISWIHNTAFKFLTCTVFSEEFYFLKKRCNASDGKREELRHGAWLDGFSNGWLAENAAENEAPVA
jgi:hypothetical protein